MTYRATPADGCAWVTGASHGIGRAVAIELATRGYEVYASARDRVALQALADESAKIGKIVPIPCDVIDRQATLTAVEEIEARRPIALAFLNAGAWWDDPVDDFGGENFLKTFEVNVFGLANSVNPVLKAMRARKRGQIALMGSIAGYGGLPNNGPYGPSKAAVISMAEGLRFHEMKRGINVQLVSSGYVKTPLTDARPDDLKLFLMSSESAAQRIVRGFERSGFEIAYPKRLALAIKLMNLLPYPLYFGFYGVSLPPPRD